MSVRVPPPAEWNGRWVEFAARSSEIGILFAVLLIIFLSSK